jgi:hypothetical protein
MNNKVVVFVSAALFVGVLSVFFLNKSKINNSMQQFGERSDNLTQNKQPSRDNCLADDCLLIDDLEYPVSELPVEIREALGEAINDEYKALSAYVAVIDKFGAVRPFSMIKGAEEQHIASLKAVYDKYGLMAPENTLLGKVVVPATLQESCQMGVDAEIINASMYREKLLPLVVDYEDIAMVFESLMNASQEKHLPAFERCN